jgi:hypothetical protein
MTNRDDVARIALLPPEVAESDSEFAFAVAGKQFVSLWRERVDPKKPKVANAEVIVVHVADLGENEALLASDPEKFFTTITTTATRACWCACRRSTSAS